ncbi:MAG: acyl-CoA thioesterase [Bdellovibrionales bacterium]|nr:acyl-CoA thioesterase [Bdellovibrionales bacterium]
MKAQNSAQSRVVMTEVVYPSHTNAIDTVFGGVVMSWVDIAGSISAIRYCGKTVVTASVDDVHFIAPAYKGDIINIKALVNFVHKTSMEVGVRVDSENPLTNQFRHIVSAYLTFVALDENKKPTLIPPLEPQTEDEKKRFKEAEIRRKWRLERRKLLGR